MSENLSYLQSHINHLPPEKQSAARRLTAEALEGGDDSPLSKMLFACEINTIVAADVQRKATESGNQFLQQMDQKLANAVQENAQFELRLGKQLQQVISDQVPALGKVMALDKLVTTVERLNVHLRQIDQGVSKLRHARVSGLLLLMTLGAVIGSSIVIGLFYKNYQQAMPNHDLISTLKAEGIYLRANGKEDGIHVTIFGVESYLEAKVRKDESGNKIGVDLVFPFQGEGK
jgi:hypothetical protein